MPFLFAAITALLFGLNTFPAKRLGDRGWNESSIAWGNFTAGLPVLLVAAALLGKWEFRSGFLPTLGFGLAGNFVAFTLYYRAIRITDVSIVMPLVSLSPLFMLVTSRVMLGEVPGPWGYVGVIMIVIGAYVLGCSRDRSNLAAPIRALARDPGARLALVVSFVWSITSNLDKRAILLSDPFSYLAVFGTATTLFYLPVVWFRDRGSNILASSGTEAKLVATLGVSHSIMVLCQMTALLSLPVAYVIAIKRAGLLVGIIVGHARNEPGIRWRLSAGFLVAAGIAMIMLGG